MITSEKQRERDHYLQHLFKEGEKLATRQKTIGTLSLGDLAHYIIEVVDSSHFYFEDEEYLAIKEVLRVYQGFLDNGGEVDFTERR